MRCKIIIPSSGVVELYDDVDISLTFQIADIKEPQKRHADYSKTITVPGTHNNNKMFQHIFDIGIDRLYNPNKKASCILQADSTSVMKGYMRLKNIIVNDKKISYEIEITGRLADLFTILGDTKIKDLTWSDLDHTYSRANQIASWVATPGSNYVYPFIDYGFTLNEIDYEVNDFFPGIYVKEIWDRIFSWAGFQYTSPSGFLTSNYFKRLFLPFNSDKMRLTTAQIEARRFRTTHTSTAYYTQALSGTTAYTDIVFDNDTTSPNQDTGGVYNTATGVWTCGASGFYNVTANINCRAKVIISAGSVGNIKQNVIFRTIDITNTIPQVNLYSQQQIMVVNTVSTGTAYYPTNIGFNMSTNGAPVYISSGTQIKVQAMVVSALQVGTATITSFGLEIDNLSSFFNKVDPEIKEGDTITMANTLPQELKMSEFITSIIKMHNLYIEYDKDTPNKLIIEPRNSFYSTTTQDWTQKRDLSKDLEITPMGALQARYYIFSYKADSDYYNAKYLNENGEVYGQKKITIDNDFLVNTYKEELVFSPTPMDSSSAQALNVQGVSNNDRYFPKIINVDSQGKVTPRVSNPRILYYGGVKSCKPWTYKSLISGSSGVTNYPYCGHMDDAIAPTLDINFGLLKEVYYDPAFNATMSDNNLYNTYWKDEIDEIIDKNSSIVTGWFHLTSKDISIVNFRDIYRFDFQNFRLNKIYDYNPLQDGLTKCEFIKIKTTVPFTSSTGSMTGGSNNNIGSVTVLPLPFPKPKGKKGINIGDTPMPIGNVISGKYNVVPHSATGIIVTGDNNSIGENGRNVTILNSSGCVVAGDVSEVCIINSSGVTVTTNNTFVLNNITQNPTQGASQYWTASGNDIYKNNSGNVGIGTTTPKGLLQLLNTSVTNPSTSYSQLFAGTMTQLFKETSSDSYLFANAYFNSSDHWIYASNGGVSGIGFNSSSPGEISFYTASSGTVSTQVTYSQRLTITQDGRIYGNALHNNSGAVTGTTNQYIASGTYTPTLTNTTNLTASTAYLCQWMRVGNVVTVSGQVDMDVTVTGDQTELSMSLPIASDFTAVQNCGGTGMSKVGTGVGVAIDANLTSNLARFYFVNGSGANTAYTFSFTYLIL